MKYSNSFFSIIHLALTLCILLSFLFLLSGCVSSRQPPPVVSGDNYSAVTGGEQLAVPAGTEVLSKEQAVEAALSNNPEYAERKLGAVEAQSDYYRRLADLTPKASLTAAGGNNTTAGTGLVTSLNAIGAQKTMTAADAGARAGAAEQLAEDSKRKLIYSVNEQYNSIQLDQSLSGINKSDADFWRQQAAIDLQKYKKTGSMKDYEAVLNDRINANNAIARSIQDNAKYQNDKYKLAGTMGLTSADIRGKTVGQPAGKSYPEHIYTPSFDLYLDMAIRNRPDLQAARDMSDSAKYNLYGAWGAFSPNLNMNASTGTTHVQDSEGVYNTSGAGTSYTAGWNAFDGGGRIAGVRQSQASYDQSREGLTERYIEIVRNVREEYIKLLSSASVANLYQENKMLSEQQRDMVLKRYREAGSNKRKPSISRLNEVQGTLIQNELNYSKAVYDVSNSKAGLGAATGLGQ